MDIAVKLAGLFTGVLMRTWLPFIRKMRQGKIKSFDKKYLHQALSSAVVAVIVTLLLIPQYDAEFTPVLDIASGIKVFATAFTFGFTANTLVNELLKWQEQRHE